MKEQGECGPHLHGDPLFGNRESPTELAGEVSCDELPISAQFSIFGVGMSLVLIHGEPKS